MTEKDEEDFQNLNKSHICGKNYEHNIVSVETTVL